jgi:hypothetical protein
LDRRVFDLEGGLLAAEGEVSVAAVSIEKSVTTTAARKMIV